MIHQTKRLLIVLGCAASLSACSGQDPPGREITVPVAATSAHPGPTVSWEQFHSFAEASSRVVDGQRVYVVEWDLPLGEDQLRAYYTSHFVEAPKSVVDGLAAGGDNAWAQPHQLQLTYCVSTSFGANYARMQQEMQRATLAWKDAANVAFTYVSSADTNCVDANTAVEIPVMPFTGGGACSFFPSQDGDLSCTSAGRALVINVADIDTWPTTPINGSLYPNIKTEGVLRHELGHVLGLRHEQILNPADAIFNCVGEVNSPGNHRQLNAYNALSVMQYPWCGGSTASDMSIQFSDAKGVMALYGVPAWLIARI